jgi:hypothetical protein
VGQESPKACPDMSSKDSDSGEDELTSLQAANVYFLHLLVETMPTAIAAPTTKTIRTQTHAAPEDQPHTHEEIATA